MMDYEELNDANEASSIPVMFRVYSTGKLTKKITEEPVKKIVLSC